MTITEVGVTWFFVLTPIGFASGTKRVSLAELGFHYAGVG